MRVVHRAADKVCCSSSAEEKQTFIKLGSLIMVEEDKDTVQQLFMTMAGEQAVRNLPECLQKQLPFTQINTRKWTAAKPWTQWPVHLSM